MRKLFVLLAMVIFLVAGCGSGGGDIPYYTSPDNPSEEPGEPTEPEEPEEPEEPPCWKTVRVYVDEYTGIMNENENAVARVAMFGDVECTQDLGGSGQTWSPDHNFFDKYIGPDLSLAPNEDPPITDLWILVYVIAEFRDVIPDITEGEPYHPDCPLYVPMGQYECGDIIEISFDAFDDTYLW